MASMKWLTDFLDEEEESCDMSGPHEYDLADTMYTSGRRHVCEEIRKLIAEHQAPYMSKQDIIDELAIMRDEERRGK
jgi:hypothetical protein